MPVCLCRDCQGLGALASGVDKVDVVDLHSSIVRAKCRSEIVVGDSVLRPALSDCHRVARVARSIRSVPVNGELRASLWNVDLLVIGPLRTVRGEQ